MLFYQVNPDSDQTRFNGSILVANELWTKAELKRAKASAKFIKKHMKERQISKFKTYWFFGARFKCTM